MQVSTRRSSPKELARLAEQRGSVGIAYTYSEPLIWFEFLLDCGRAFREAGMKNVLVTNGYINEEPLRELLPLVDAMNIDLKSMDPDFYREVCGGKLEPVLRTIQLAKESGCHVEVTHLLIPGLNDSDEELDRLIGWVWDLGIDTPLHFSAYFPRYKMDRPPTPGSTVAHAWEKARAYLRYVYAGNVYIPGAGDMYCYHCEHVLIRRMGYSIEVPGIRARRCRRCQTEVEMVMD